MRARRFYLFNRKVESRFRRVVFFQSRCRRGLRDGGDVRAFLCEVYDGERVDFQTAFGAAVATVVEPIQSRRLLALLGMNDASCATMR